MSEAFGFGFPAGRVGLSVLVAFGLAGWLVGKGVFVAGGSCGAQADRITLAMDTTTIRQIRMDLDISAPFKTF